MKNFSSKLPLLLRGTPAAPPRDDAHAPAGVRCRVHAHQLARPKAGNIAAHPMAYRVGESVLIGGAIAASTAMSEFMALRLAGGLRWAGDTRAAALRVGPRLAYPVGVGLSDLVPHLLGTTEEALEGTADTFLTPKDTTRAASPRR